MRLGNPLLAVHNAMARAILQDLPDIEYKTRDWNAWHQLSKEAQADAIRNRTEPQKTGTRRPHEDDVEIIMFAQTWGSTALGYGGMGGAAVTSAYTVVVSDGDCHCVYFGGGELAYKVSYSKLNTTGKENLTADIRNHNMVARNQHVTRYPLI